MRLECSLGRNTNRQIADVCESAGVIGAVKKADFIGAPESIGGYKRAVVIVERILGPGESKETVACVPNVNAPQAVV